MDTCPTLLKASRPLRAEDTTTCCFHRVTITMAGGPSEKSASYSEWIDLTESEGFNPSRSQSHEGKCYTNPSGTARDQFSADNNATKVPQLLKSLRRGC